jgi:hypothetical protein
MIELDNAVVRPEAFSNLRARDHLPRAFQKHSEYLEGLLLKSDFAPLLAHFSLAKVDLKRAEEHT